MNYSKLKSILFEKCSCDQDRTKIKATARPEDSPKNKILNKTGNIKNKIIDEEKKKSSSKKTKIIINPVKLIRDDNAPNDSYIDTVGRKRRAKIKYFDMININIQTFKSPSRRKQ